MELRPRILKPYSFAVGWLKASPLARNHLTPQQISDCRAIAALGAWGERLEELGATWTQLRWVAGPRTHHEFDGAIQEREARVEALTVALRKGLTQAEINRIQRTMPRARTSKRWAKVPLPKIAPRKEVPKADASCSDGPAECSHGKTKKP